MASVGGAVNAVSVGVVLDRVAMLGQPASMAHLEPSPVTALPTDALAEVLPHVAEGLPRCRLGAWPTPIEALAIGRDRWVKREDLSSPLYGGNKVRCLEPVIAHAARQGATRLVGTGAWGSNQALALAVHAPRHGFETAALLFPQPPSRSAALNLRSLMATTCQPRILPTIAHFPFAWLRAWAAGDRIIPPGAAVPRGALGHVSAAIEVALAVRAGLLPAPRHIVLAIGSTCTTAGLLVGFAAAARLGVGFETPPLIHAVRVTPWPVTASWRVVGLALRTAQMLAELGGPDVADRGRLAAALRVEGGELGRGYGHATAAGRDAIHRFDTAGGPHLDTTYAGKAGAWLVGRGSRLDGPTIFWATKSAIQPPTAGSDVRCTPRIQRWLSRSGDNR